MLFAMAWISVLVTRTPASYHAAGVASLQPAADAFGRHDFGGGGAEPALYGHLTRYTSLTRSAVPDDAQTLLGAASPTPAGQEVYRSQYLPKEGSGPRGPRARRVASSLAARKPRSRTCTASRPAARRPLASCGDSALSTRKVTYRSAAAIGAHRPQLQQT